MTLFNYVVGLYIDVREVYIWLKPQGTIQHHQHHVDTKFYFTKQVGMIETLIYVILNWTVHDTMYFRENYSKTI